MHSRKAWSLAFLFGVITLFGALADRCLHPPLQTVAIARESDLPSVVSIVKKENLTTYAAVKAAIEEAFALALQPDGISGLIHQGDVVLLKPNVGVGEDLHEITDWNVVRSVAEIALAHGATRVIVAEGDGTNGQGIQHFRKAGYDLNFPGVSFVDFNSPSVAVSRVYVQNGLWPEPVILPSEYVSADVVITIPAMKTHNRAGVSGALKNAFGAVPTRYYSSGVLWRDRIHSQLGINKSIVQINLARTPDFTVVDGILAGEGFGPWEATPVAMNVIIAGRDPVSVDAVTARMMGFDPERIPYLVYAQAKGLGIFDLDKVAITGAPLHAVQKQFASPDSDGRIFRKATLVPYQAGGGVVTYTIGLTDQNQVISGQYCWRGRDDLSAEIAMYWDDEYLYGTAIITDDYTVFPEMHTFPNDSGERLELYWSGSDQSVRQDPRYGKWDFLLAIPVARNTGLIDISTGRQLPRSRATCSLSQHGYTLEFQISFDELNGFAPRENFESGLDIAIVDHDGDSCGKSKMSWTGSADSMYNVFHLGIALLSATLPPVITGTPTYTPVIPRLPTDICTPLPSVTPMARLRLPVFFRQ